MPARAPFPVSDHCDGRRFFNPRNHVNRGWHEVLKWRLTSRAATWPARVELAPRRPPPAPTDGRIAVTFVNHATFLVQTPCGNLLTDPVWGERASPLAWSGPRRVHPPGVRLEDLPRIDVVLLSHDHYDHCHLPTLRTLARRDQPLLVSPLGHAGLAARAGLRRHVELDWWQRHAVQPDLAVTLTPARHWSNRLSGARNGRLWGGFFVQTPGHRVYFVGDTGYDADLFRKIGRDLGAPDLAMIPIGAYAPRWFMAPMHCDPAEAVAIHRDVGARRSLGMHWGTFQLTDEAREAPVRELAAARQAAGLDETTFRAIEPGESVWV